jgi:hypothetical protein
VTKLNLTRSDYSKYYSRPANMLERRVTDNTLTTLLDFGNLSLDNTYNRIQQLEQANHPTEKIHTDLTLRNDITNRIINESDNTSLTTVIESVHDYTDSIQEGDVVAAEHQSHLSW